VQRGGVARRHEGAAHVAVALGGRQRHLILGGTATSQGGDDGQRQAAGEIVRLIESPRSQTGVMQRHRYGGNRIDQQFGGLHAQQARERTRQRTAALIFQRVNDLAEHAVVGTDCGGAIERVRPAAAAPARVGWIAAPGEKRIAAAGAERRREQAHGAPAVSAHRAIGRMRQRLGADRARRRQRDGEERVEPRPHALPGGRSG
jgi:hypothetical protein